MPSLEAIGQAFLVLLQYGALGAFCIICLVWVVRKDRELRQIAKDRLEDQKEHTKDLLKLQTECKEEMAELVRHYDMSLAAVEATLENVHKGRHDPAED